MFRDMTDQELIAAYRTTRNALWGVGEMARSTTLRHHRVRLARQTGRLVRDLEIIVAIANQRGLDVLAG